MRIPFNQYNLDDERLSIEIKHCMDRDGFFVVRMYCYATNLAGNPVTLVREAKLPIQFKTIGKSVALGFDQMSNRVEHSIVPLTEKERMELYAIHQS